MVRILTGAEAGVKSTLVMPTDAELRLLAKVVYAKYPFLDTRAELGSQHDLAFKRTFWGAGWLGRLPEPERRNAKHSIWFAEHLSQLLRDHRIDHEVEVRMFAAAALAHGDVPHTIIPGRWPFDCSWGLTYPHAGRPSSDAWRRVLEGALLPSSPLPYSLHQQSAPRVVRLDQDRSVEPYGLVDSTTR
jgi:hypothetical protein